MKIESRVQCEAGGQVRFLKGKKIKFHRLESALVRRR